MLKLVGSGPTRWLVGKSRGLSRVLALSASWVVLTTSAHAQTSPRIVSPDRPDQNPPAERTKPAPPIPAPSLHERNAKIPIRPFTLKRVEIAGSSLRPAALKQAYAPFLGQTIDNAKLSGITTAVAAAFPKADVALFTVFVPEQSFQDGVLKLTAVEGYVQAAVVEGDIGAKRRALVRRYLEPIVRERPLHTSTLQRYVSLIRDMPGLTVATKLERGSRVGGVKLTLTLKAHPVQVGFGFENRGTALLGTTQATTDLYLNGLLFGGDQLHGSIVLPLDNLGLFQDYSLAYSAPLDANGTVVQLSGSYLRTRPEDIPIQGSAISAGVQITHPFLRSFVNNLYLTGSLDGINNDNALYSEDFSNERTRAFRVALSYNRTTDANLLTASATVSSGIDGLGARLLAGDEDRLDFHKLNAKVLDTIRVSRNISLRLDLFGQLTGDRLPASEQVALGGDEFGRAYEADIIQGDTGAAGSAEFDWRPAKGLPALLKGSEAYVFADGGQTWSRARYDVPSYESHLASVGSGFRAELGGKSVIQIEAARGLYNPVIYENREVFHVFINVKTLF